MKAIRCFLLGCALASSSLQAGNSFDRYPAKTLQEILAGRVEVEKTLHDAPRDGKFFVVNPEVGHALVVFQGKTRAIEPATRDFLDLWAKYDKMPAMSGLYEEEILVREGKTDYWLPMQKVLMGYLRDEAKAGTPIEVWVEWFGSYRSAPGELVHVVCVTRFDSDPDTGQPTSRQ